MKTFSVIMAIVSIGCILTGIVEVVKGVNKKDNSKLNWGYLKYLLFSSKYSLRERSGKELLSEGIIGILIGILSLLFIYFYMKQGGI